MDVTIGTTTYMREDYIRRLLDSIDNSRFNGRVIVVDGNDEPLDLSKYDIEQIHTPDSNIAKAHNIVAEELEENFLLWLHDDMIYKDEPVETLKKDIDKYPSLGWVSFLPIGPDGRENPAHNVIIKDNYIFKAPIVLNGLTFCDQVATAGLYRKEVFDDILWDERLDLYEHEAYALEFMNTDWLAAVDENATIPHRHGESKDENKYREHLSKVEKKASEIMKEEYNIKGIRIGIANEVNNYLNFINFNRLGIGVFK